MTRRGRMVLGLGLAMLVAGRILGVTELFGLAVAAAVVVLVGTIRVRSSHLRVSLGAKVVPQVVSANERAALELTVENMGTVPTPARRLRLLPQGGAPGPIVEVPRLVPGERAAISLALPTSRRGRHEVAGFDAIVVDGLGIAERRLTGVGTSRYGVRPQSEYLPQTLPLGGGGADLETTRSAADRIRSGASLLRPYVEGDDLRRAHWPTTARVGDIMVREGGDRERDEGAGVTLVLIPRTFPLTGPAADAATVARPGLGDAAFEDAVGAIASLAVAAEQEGPFRLLIPGVSDSGEGFGLRHLDSVLEALIDVSPQPLSASELERWRMATPGADPESLVTLRPGAGLDQAGNLGAVATDGAVLLAAACADPDALAALCGASVEHVAPKADAVVVICAGATTSWLEPMHRGRLLVHLERGGNLGALWSAGDQALVRA